MIDNSTWENITGVIFSGVSLTTATAVSVDRLLALSRACDTNKYTDRSTDLLVLIRNLENLTISYNYEFHFRISVLQKSTGGKICILV